MDETVKLDISISIEEHDLAWDTGLTVEEWNALDDDQRSEIHQEAWNFLSQRDNGGVRVVTEGATEL